MVACMLYALVTWHIMAHKCLSLMWQRLMLWYGVNLSVSKLSCSDREQIARCFNQISFVTYEDLHG